MSQSKEIVIWGAGKIGRGFVADLFQGGGYKITFVDASKELCDNLKKQGKYTVIKAVGADERSESLISGFDVLHRSEEKALLERVDRSSFIAVVLFPQAFEDTATFLAQVLNARGAAGSQEPFNVLMCANIMHPSAKFREFLDKNLTDKGRAYVTGHVGFIDTLLIRIAIEPTPEMKQKDPLVVFTNGYPEMPVDKLGFKGPLPEIPGMLLTENIAAEETRKLYTYNMAHAVMSYMGTRKGLKDTIEAMNDPEILQLVKLTLQEVSFGLQKEFGFTKPQMVEWSGRVIKNFSNPILRDTLSRLGADPIRKLKRDDRLAGPALMCRRNGVLPYYLSKAIAYAFLFANPGDAACTEIAEFVKVNGIKEGVRKYCQIQWEAEIVQLVADHYARAAENGPLAENQDKVALLAKAFELGFNYEKIYKGCAQCAIMALFELSGQVHPVLYQAATALSGGIGLCGDGSCGGYTGGLLFMGSFVGRRLHVADGDKDPQYRAYEHGMKLHDRMVETYGSITCKEVHTCIFGKDYCLRTKPVRDEFEAAGGHADKCTVVIGWSAMLVVEILLKENFPWFVKRTIAVGLPGFIGGGGGGGSGIMSTERTDPLC